MNSTSLAHARQLLDSSGFSGKLAPSTLDSLLSQATVRSYAQNQLLCLRGDTIAELRFILDGNIEVSIEDDEGRRSICWYVGPGQWLGLISIIDGLGSVHNFRAHAETTALCLPRRVFLDALNRDHGLSLMCLNLLSERSRAIYTNQAADALMPLQARIARLLLMLMAEHGDDSNDNVELRMKFTQEDFAAMLGISRQSLNRELRILEAEGTIAVAYSRITLCDLAALRRAVAATAFS